MPNEFSIVYLRQKIYLTHLNGLNSVGVKRGLRCGLFLAERRDLGLIGLYIVWPSSPLWNIIITLLLHLFSPSSCYVLMNAAAATTADFWTTMLEHPRFSPSSCWVTHERRRQRRCYLAVHAPKMHVSDAKIRGCCRRVRALFSLKCSPPEDNERRTSSFSIFSQYYLRRPTHGCATVQWVLR